MCDECGKRFALGHRLMMHKKYVHRSVKGPKGK